MTTFEAIRSSVKKVGYTFLLYWGWVNALCPQSGQTQVKNVADAVFCENSLSR